MDDIDRLLNLLGAVADSVDLLSDDEVIELLGMVDEKWSRIMMLSNQRARLVDEVADALGRRLLDRALKTQPPSMVELIPATTVTAGRVQIDLQDAAGAIVDLLIRKGLFDDRR